MIIRATIAQENPLALAHAAQHARLCVTTWQSYGASRWGVEPGATFETAVSWGDEALRVCAFLDRLLRANRQECAYVTIDGAEAHLYYPGGRTEPIGALPAVPTSDWYNR